MPDILSPPLLRLTSRKPLWLDLQPVDIKSRWRHNMEVGSGCQFSPSAWPHNPATRFRPPSATVVSAEPFLHGTGHSDTAVPAEWNGDLQTLILCPCGETQTMSLLSHIVESCPLTKLNGGLSRLHSADEDAVSSLTSYGSWNAYEKKNSSTRVVTSLIVWVEWIDRCIRNDRMWRRWDNNARVVTYCTQ